MGLADFTPFKAEIISKGVTVSVRGLSMDDCSVLVRAHLDGITNLLEMAEGIEDKFGGAAFFMQAIQTAPNFLFDVIAIAADEPSYASDARKLPAGAQIAILQKIIELTLEDIGGPKSLFALVKGLAGKAKSPVGQRAKERLTSTDSNEAA